MSVVSAFSPMAMMQEHKSFLIRDLLGDVLAERVQGKMSYYVEIVLVIIIEIENYHANIIKH